MSLLAAGTTIAAAETMNWPDLKSRPLPQTDLRLPYGTDPNQFAELWLPEGKGPHPTVVMIHGGCWQNAIANLSLMNYIADDLRRRGIAVWNIEYRSSDQDGGGYPGTFLDAANAADALRQAAPRYGLDLSRVVAAGHSAGGHLAFFLATRDRLPADSPLRSPNPLHLVAAHSWGGLPDLIAARALPRSCGAGLVDKLTGAPRANWHTDTSPAELLPASIPLLLVHGALDPISPPEYGQGVLGKALRGNGQARIIVVPGMGHVELIAPGTAAWEVEVAELKSALGIR